MKILPSVLLTLLLAGVASSSTAAGAARLRVGTYNIGHFDQGKLTNSIGGYQDSDVTAAAQRWRAWIASQKLDILGVQEWNQYFDKAKTLNAETELLAPYYQNRIFGPARQPSAPWIYNGIATNLPLARRTPDIVELSHANYYGVIGEINLGGEKITVISFHNPWQTTPDYAKDYRGLGFDLLKAELQKHTHFIAFGDTNYNNNGMQQTLQSLGFNIANGLNGAFLATTKGGSRIDQIITSSDIHIENVSAPKTGLNDEDHFPLLATLVLPDTLAPLPSITTQPANATITTGQNASFTIAASSTPAPTYQWQSSPDGTTWTDVSGATSTILTLAAVTAGMSGTRYRCVATNLAGDTASNAATLTVNYGPTITTQPAHATVAAGETASFIVASNGTPAPTYQWQSSPDGTTWTDVSGATSAILTLTAVTAGMSGTRYRCVATNSAGSATSNTAALTVVSAAQALKTALEASGTATVTVTGSINLSPIGGATVTSAKTITGADASATIAGGLTLASGANGTVVLGVNFTGGTFVIGGANDVTVSHCTFTDTPVSIIGGSDNIAFSWNKFAATAPVNGIAMASAEITQGSGSAMSISSAGAVTGILLAHNYFADGLKTDIPVVASARVLMFNNYIAATGNTTATIAGAGAQILSVRNIYQGVNNPIIKQSTGLLRTLDNFISEDTGTTALGEDDVFVPAYSHIMNPAGIDEPSATTLASRISANAGNTAGKDSITPAQTNGSSRITVTGASVTSNSTGATVSGGGSFTLTANPTGFAPIARQWYLDNFAITSATNKTYAVTNASATDHAGAYAVALTATTGEIITSAAFTVTVGVLAAPVITTHPAAQTITVGDNATFIVTATGESLAYQWMKNSVDVTGATSASYTITNSQQSHAGSYTVRVSNPSGFVTSNAATLTVNTSGGTSGGGGGAPSAFFLAALAAVAALRFARKTS